MSDNIHLPGGSATFSRDNIVNKIESSIEDEYHMGRWTGSTYRLEDNKKLNVISAYCVLDQKVTATNSMSTNSQQHQILRSRGITAVKPRTQFIINFCQQFKSKCDSPNKMTILMIDANECTSDPENQGLQQLMEECGLINIYKHVHDDHEEFPTHINGSKGTANILQYIHKMGYIKFHECFDSDHHGIYCDLSSKLFQKTPPPSVKRERIVGSNSTNAEGGRYIKHLHAHLLSNNIFIKSKQLLDNSLNSTGDINLSIQQLSCIDKIITDGMLNAERTQCKKRTQ
jgi:hypothetical protein